MIFFLPRANDVCFLGCLRSLSKNNIKIISGIYKWNKDKFLSDKSKFLKEKIHLPNPATREKEFIKRLINYIKKIKKNKNKKIFYLPTSDTNMMVAINNWNRLKKYFNILGSKNFSKPNKKVYCKFTMYHFLKKIKINTPLTVKFSKKKCLELLNKGIDIIIKPSFKDYSQSFYKNNFYKAVNIANPNDLKIFINKNKKKLKNLIAQEHVDFKNIKHELPIYLYVNKHHKIIFSVCGVKWFIFPDKYGTAAILGIDDNKELENISQKIVTSLKWRGILMIEFIFNNKKKKWEVIEMNGRPWLMIDFFRRLNFSFLKLLIYDYMNLDLTELIKQYEINKKNYIKKKSMHIDLSILQKSINNNKKNFELIKKILKKSKNISISSFDNNDLKPFVLEKSSINNKFLKNIIS